MDDRVQVGFCSCLHKYLVRSSIPSTKIKSWKNPTRKFGVRFLSSFHSLRTSCPSSLVRDIMYSPSHRSASPTIKPTSAGFIVGAQGGNRSQVLPLVGSRPHLEASFCGFRLSLPEITCIQKPIAEAIGFCMSAQGGNRTLHVRYRLSIFFVASKYLATFSIPSTKIKSWT